MANKGEIRNLVLEQVDWNPNQSTDFKAKVDRLINRAYQAMSLEAPFLFFEEEAKIVTMADTSSVSSHAFDKIKVEATDDRVLTRSYLEITATADRPQAWAFDGTWDGRLIEITDSDGTVHRRRIREVWSETETDVLVYRRDRISIDLPWPNVTDTGMTYRIFTDAYELPADVVELRNAQLWDSNHYKMAISTQEDMERAELTDFQGRQAGRPYRLYRGRHMQIDAPMTKPSVILDNNESWLSPEPPGEFEYCYSYAWGKRDAILNSPSGILEPRWESSPSPISSAIATSGSSAGSIKVHMTNIDQVTNFYNEYGTSSVTTDAKRKTHSGLYKRIYVRRKSIDTTGSSGEISEVEVSDVFYLLAEVSGDTTVYTHNGTATPDYYRRLKAVHGYQSVRLWPHPDAAYQIDLRVLRRPQPLIADTDTPRVHEEAIDALIQRILVLFYEMNGQLDVSQLITGRYQLLLQTLTKRYGNISALRVGKRAARVSRSGRATRVSYAEDHDFA